MFTCHRPEAENLMSANAKTAIGFSGMWAYACLAGKLLQDRNSWDEEAFAASELLPALRRNGAPLMNAIATWGVPNMSPIARHYFAFTLGLVGGEMASTAAILIEKYAASDDIFIRSGAIEALELLDSR